MTARPRFEPAPVVGPTAGSPAYAPAPAGPAAPAPVQADVPTRVGAAGRRSNETGPAVGTSAAPAEVEPVQADDAGDAEAPDPGLPKLVGEPGTWPKVTTRYPAELQRWLRVHALETDTTVERIIATELHRYRLRVLRAQRRSGT